MSILATSKSRRRSVSVSSNEEELVVGGRHRGTVGDPQEAQLPPASFKLGRRLSSVSSEGEQEASASAHQRQPHQHDRHNSATFMGTHRRPQRLSTRSVSSEDFEETPAGHRQSSTTGALPRQPPPVFPHQHLHPHDPQSMTMTQPVRPQRRTVVTFSGDREMPAPAAGERRASVVVDPDTAPLPAALAGRRKSRRASVSHSLMMYRLGQAARLQPKHSLRAYGRLALICVRLCELSEANLEKERGEMLSFREIINLYNAGIDKSGIFFDLRDYRADKQNHLSQEARRVLQTPPADRSQHGISYLLIALRNIASFAEYPTRMQKKLCQVAWFESYEPNRTIVREGDPPRAFYFILSGSVVVTKHDRHYGTTQTLVTLDQGMSFGELAVITGSRRQATVSSQTNVELLCISGPDFEDIFMAGRKVITDPVQDPFLKTVDFLTHWPVQKLSHHPQGCMFHFFNRGQVLVRDSNNSDWIYIVKSGSLSVMKKLHHVDAMDDENAEAKSKRDGTSLRLPQTDRWKQEKKSPEAPEFFRNSMAADRRLEQTLPGVFNAKERLGLIDYDRIIAEYRSRILSKMGSEAHTLTLPPIPASESRRVSTPEASSTTMEGEGLERADSDMAAAETWEGNRRKEDTSFGNEQLENAAAATGDKLTKGVYLGPSALDSQTGQLTPTNQDARRTSLESNGSSEVKTDNFAQWLAEGSPKAHLYRLNIDYQRIFREHVGRKTMADQLDYKGLRDFRYTDVDLNPMFVVAKVLEKGQYFGVSQVVYPEQPSLSLVSNGAELVVLSKKLFLDYANDACMRHLRKTESPFPAQDVLQNNLQDFINWKAHRARVYHRLVSGLEQKQYRRKQYLPSALPGQYNFRSGPV